MARHNVLNIAHRGARSLAPENTLAAARAALAAGADMWETDAGVTRDGVLILFHDTALLRTTNAGAVFPDRTPWTVSSFEYEELRRLDAGSWFLQTDPFDQVRDGAVPAEELATYRGARIPTLEEALVFTRDNQWRINIELKRLPAQLAHFPVVERVLALIDRLALAPDLFVLSSFEHRWLKQIRRLRPDIEVQAVVGLSRVRPIRWDHLEFDTYNARHSLVSETKVRELVRMGRRVNLWAVNEEDDMRRFIAAGATGIITDFPQRLSRILNESTIKNQ
jgi:glycerophosphoryl diester phosphodiesterase